LPAHFFGIRFVEVHAAVVVAGAPLGSSGAVVPDVGEVEALIKICGCCDQVAIREDLFYLLGG
jgi:hypothetical protein